ncbi:unnamed protein product [Phaedon cochleariae]|uniref:G patch domain-containing protein n=1 Tax=Phaedon cochleariae TaxID=80249 RepID=A0A9N9X781_PHACE|nr:unnamed protein product [Phaedon cochleariae]
MLASCLPMEINPSRPIRSILKWGELALETFDYMAEISGSLSLGASGVDPVPRYGLANDPSNCGVGMKIDEARYWPRRDVDLWGESVGKTVEQGRLSRIVFYYVGRGKSKTWREDWTLLCYADAQGRRRFHGAFTGGFSAGFFNTVGSLEGWTPSEFKSTRQEKARGVSQKPEDFMDDEDLGEYGIAPQVVRATKDYSTSKKRRKQVFSEGPIPGQPVLETLLTSGNETVGYLLLKNIGLKEKIEKHLDEVNSASKTYGCQMPVQYKIPTKIENKQYQIPDIYRECLEKPKSNTFGLDYKGLDRSHVNLFRSSNLVVTDRNNKKFSIGGQAFGVGAFEEDDDDIYMREDMSNYDHELIKEKCSTSSDAKHGDLVFGMFETEEVDRASINPNIRAKYLGEETPEVYTQSQPIQKKEVPTNTHKNPEGNKPANAFSVLSLMSDRFVSASQKEDVTDILELVEKSETTHGTKDMREAARMKMFGRLTRVTLDWRPCSCLCKRFNVPEPFMDRPEEKNRKRTKNLIFENQKHV